MGGLYFSMGDIYPSMGYGTTRFMTIPEAEDQNTLVDDQEMAHQAQVQHNPATSKSILLSIAILVVVMILLAWKR